MFHTTTQHGYDRVGSLLMAKSSPDANDKQSYPETILSSGSGKSKYGTFGLRGLLRGYSKRLSFWREDYITDVDSDDPEKEATSCTEAGVRPDKLLNSVNNKASEPEMKTMVKEVPKRIIVIKNILNTASVNNVLSLIYGGPLEKVVSQGNSLEVSFIRPENARRFYDIASTSGLITVNGKKLEVEWADHSNKDAASANPPLPKDVCDTVLNDGCRRCLIFSQNVPGKMPRNTTKLFYPDPAPHLSKLDINQIKADFSSFGEIVSFGPVISRKLCFSIHFADVAFAKKAKEACEKYSTEMHSRYSEWTIWYAKDNTDRPCPSV